MRSDCAMDSCLDDELRGNVGASEKNYLAMEGIKSCCVLWSLHSMVV